MATPREKLSANAEAEPSNLHELLEMRFSEAYDKQAEIGGFIIEPTDGRAHFIRLHIESEDYDLMAGKPLAGSDFFNKIAYWLVTIRFRNYHNRGNEDMLILNNDSTRIFEDIGNTRGSPIDYTMQNETIHYLRNAQLIDPRV